MLIVVKMPSCYLLVCYLELVLFVDVLTCVTQGGNDAELSNILNQCVFNWFVLNRNQASTIKLGKILEEEWAQNLDVDVDVVSRGCQKQLETSQMIIRSPDFDHSLDTLLEATKKKLGNG